MRFVYVMDPMDRVLPDKDTTFAFQRAAQRRGHKSLHAELRDVYVLDGDSFERAREIVDRVRRGERLVDPKTYRAWRCKGCNELVEGQFQVCWKCGNAKSG